MQCTITHSSQPPPVAHPRRIPGSHASPRVHWPPARQSWQSTLPVPADASMVSVQDVCTRCMASRPCVSPARFYCLGGGAKSGRTRSALSCPLHVSMLFPPIPSSTYIPPLCLWHQIIGIKFDSRASFFPPCCKSPSLSSLQFPASFSPTLPQPHIREKAHTKSEIPLNLSESSVRRVATVPPSCQFAHGPLCICDHLVSRPLLLPPSATLLLGWNARPPFGRVLRATTRL